MKQLIRSRNVSAVGKLCALILALFVLCVSAPSYAALIESNGTGKYEITGKNTWGLNHPVNGDDEVESLTIVPGASLTLDAAHSSIYGNGNMIISGGGELIGQYSLDPDDMTGGRGGTSTIYGLQSIKDITLSTLDKGVMFTFYAFPDENDHWASGSATFGHKSMSIENVKRSSNSDLSSIFYLGNLANKNISIDDGMSISITDSHFEYVSLMAALNSSVNISGGSEILIDNSILVNDSTSASSYGVGGAINNGSVTINEESAELTGVEITTNASYELHGQSRMAVKNVTIASEGEADGFLGVSAGIDTICISDRWKVESIIDSSLIEISGITFEGTGMHTLYITGGASASSYVDYEQFGGGAESKIVGASEIVISGDGAFSGISNGYVYCGGTAIGRRATSTVGSARLTFKDINADGTHGTFNGVISGQGRKAEASTVATDDYTDSVLGDSVLVLDNVKADISSNRISVKYFDEIELANNTEVKLTTFDGNVKKITVTGAWDKEVVALSFVRPVYDEITVDYSQASGVTDAYFTDDGMKFIVNGTGGTTPEEPAEPEQPSTGGGSGGGGGGCNAGFGFGGLLALAGLAVILRKNGGR